MGKSLAISQEELDEVKEAAREEREAVAEGERRIQQLEAEKKHALMLHALRSAEAENAKQQINDRREQLERVQTELDVRTREVEQLQGAADVDRAAKDSSWIDRRRALECHIELLRRFHRKGTHTSKTLRICRENIVGDFADKLGRTAQAFMKDTNVVFLDGFGREENGIDESGLTNELFTEFWRETFGGRNVGNSSARASSAIVEGQGADLTESKTAPGAAVNRGGGCGDDKGRDAARGERDTMVFGVGCRVTALWWEYKQGGRSENSGKYFPATVRNYDAASVTYDLEYDDGNVDTMVPSSDVRDYSGQQTVPSPDGSSTGVATDTSVTLPAPLPLSLFCASSPTSQVYLPTPTAHASPCDGGCRYVDVGRVFLKSVLEMHVLPRRYLPRVVLQYIVDPAKATAMLSPPPTIAGALLALQELREYDASAARTLQNMLETDFAAAGGSGLEAGMFDGTDNTDDVTDENKAQCVVAKVRRTMLDEPRAALDCMRRGTCPAAVLS